MILITQIMDNWMFECKSSMDKGVWMKNIFVFTVFIGIALVIYITSGLEVPVLIIITIYLIIIILGLLKTPVSYHLSKQFLLIKRRFTPIRIPLKEIALIRPFEKSDKKGLLRYFGLEGAVGNYGIYGSKNHKTLNIYTSRDTNWVFIQTKQGKKIVISPDDVSLVEKVNDYLP